MIITILGALVVSADEKIENIFIPGFTMTCYFLIQNVRVFYLFCCIYRVVNLSLDEMCR